MARKKSQDQSNPSDYEEHQKNSSKKEKSAS